MESSELIPKYHKTRELLLEKIRTGEWKVGDEIPSEQDLCSTYNVSRGTLRRAVDALVRQGLLTRIQGKSTFVAKPKIPIFSKGFRADIRSSGQSANSKILYYEKRPCTDKIASLLSIANDQMICELSRIIEAEHEPIILEHVYIPCKYGENLSADDLLHTSLLDLLPQSCGVILKKAIESYEPTLLTQEEAHRLNAKPGNVAILDQAITFDINDTPVFVSNALIRGDRARVATEVTFTI